MPESGFRWPLVKAIKFEVQPGLIEIKKLMNYILAPAKKFPIIVDGAYMAAY